ncbi:hypothetical protein ACJ73_02014 [Blastomyces percursus]|uniref:Uncharacterized protein n=1 Tax=Blastomyces percursus TaxID=1658174 RepID=A0A1J9RG37_9EURO|nr:hypothetical protein ACJ73_02014 [Blastomyces percursus]
MGPEPLCIPDDGPKEDRLAKCQNATMQLVTGREKTWPRLCLLGSLHEAQQAALEPATKTARLGIVGKAREALAAHHIGVHITYPRMSEQIRCLQKRTLHSDWPSSSGWK